VTGQPFVVAIDGPAASGKGTLARRLAERFHFAHLDTGKLYRATALLALEAGGDPADPAAGVAAARRVDPAILADPRLSEEPITRASAIVAAIPVVRIALLQMQRNFVVHPPSPARGAVLYGRDIGTVVCPAAAAAAPDAVIIDTTGLDADQVFERASKLIARALAAHGG
jgi:cytidylate kinase